MYTIKLDTRNHAVVILDQTALPYEQRYVTLTSLQDVWYAIKTLQVRGAPAIGVAAAMGLYVHMRRTESGRPNNDELKNGESKNSELNNGESRNDALNNDAPNTGAEALAADFYEAKAYLQTARPTAVNLRWALEQMAAVFEANRQASRGAALDALRHTAQAMQDADAAVCEKIGTYGAALLTSGMGVLTHCNAGALATCGCGTALAPIYTAHRQGVPLRVYADETRPLLQGARLTAYELHKAGVDVTLICDNMASYVMQKGWVDAVFVGCDRVAANGDAANKIGTSGVAILAAAYGVPFYVCAPFSTIDPSCADGSGIIIEERDGAEITDLWYERPMAPAGIKTCNPSFDVTPARYITAFITEKGIIKPPYAFTQSTNILN